MSRTAFSAGNLTNLRARPQAFPLYLAVHRPRTIYTARVASIPTWPTDGTGVGTIAFSSGSGTIGNVLAGMTLFIGSSAGARDKGILRIRTTVSGSPFAVSATAQGQIDIQVNDYLTVVEDFRLFAKRQRYAPTVSGSTGAAGWVMDFGISYAAATNNNASYGPQAVLGCAAIKYGAGSQAFLFDGTRSIAHTAGSSIASYLWTFPDGTTSTSSAPTWNTSTAYTDGRYVSLRVTDSAGATHTGYRLVWKFDSSNLPYTAMVTETESLEWGAGVSTEVRLRGVATISDIPVGAHVALFTASVYGGVSADIGGNFPNRANIMLEGWIKEGSIHQEPESGDVTFTIVTSDDELARQFAFPVDLTNTSGTPADWLTMKNITLDRVALFICRYQSTILDVVDVTFVGNTAAATNTKKYQSLSPMLSVWQLLKDNYAWLPGGQATADSQSAIYFEQDAQIAGNVSSQVNMFTLGDADIRGEVTIQERDYLPNAQITLYGIDSSTGVDLPIGARAGDDPVGYAETVDEVPAGLMMTAAQSRTWSGNMRAKLNNPYPEISIPLSGAWRIDPAPQSFIFWTPDSADLKRVPPGWASGIRLLVRRVDYEFNSGETAMLSTVHCEPEVSGPDGVSVAFVNQSTLTLNRRRISLATPPPAPVPPGETDETIPVEEGDGKILYVATIAGLYRTLDCTVVSPEWEQVYDAVYTVTDAWFNGKNPTNGGYIIDRDVTGPQGGVYYSENLSTLTPTWSEGARASVNPFSNAFVNWAFISSTLTGYVYTLMRGNDGSSANTVAIGGSTDNSATFTYSEANDWGPVPPDERQGNDAPNCCYISWRDTNRIYYAGARATANEERMYESSTGLAGISDVSASAYSQPNGLHVPVNDNATEQVVYIWSQTQIARSITGMSGTFVDITPTGWSAAGGNSTRALWTKKEDRQIVFAINQDGELYGSTDAGDNWVTLTAIGTFPFLAFYYHSTSGNLYAARSNSFLPSPGDRPIVVSTDGGATWVDKQGNWASVIGNFDGAVAIWAV